MKIRTTYGSIALLISSFLWCSTLNAKTLFVSPSGSDSVSYDSNSIDSPWQSLTYAIYNLRAGDILNIRGGTYYPTKPLLIRSDYANRTYGGDASVTMNAETGSSSQPVIVQGYDQESVVVDLRNSSSPSFIEIDDKDYWEFRNFKVINGGSIFVVGKEGPANHITFDGLELISNVGGDNSGTIKIYSDYADFITINNCTLIGPGTGSSIHQNTAALFARVLNNLIITNNYISNAPYGIYYKHRTEKDSDPTEIIIRNNIITNTSRAAAQFETVGAVIDNNIITPNNAPIKFNEAAGSPGGDYNQISHNTFGVKLELRWDTQSGDPIPGAIGNTVTNNLFLEPMDVHWYSSVPHETTSNNNLFAGNYAVGENRITYQLSDWQSHSAQDRSSKSGTPAFTGSTLGDDPASYQLTDYSPGFRAASDGTDIGANVELVGPNRDVASLARPMAPELKVQ